MAQIETWYRQDIKQPVQVHHLHGNVFSQDNQGNVIGVEVFDGDTPASLSGSVSASIVRSDGGTVAATGVLSGNKLSVALPAAAYAVPGVISIVLKLTTGAIVLSLLAVVAIVYASSTDTPVDPGTIMPSIANLIEAINEAVATIPDDYEELSMAVNSGIQRVVHTIDWRNGYYDTSTGTYTTVTTYKCTTTKYPREIFPFLTNWLINAYDYVSLFNGDTYAGYYNSANPTSITTLEWDSFYLTIQNSGHPSGTDDIRFVTLGNLDEIQQDSVFNIDIPVIWWRNGVYKIADGTYNEEQTGYKCTQLTYKKEYLKFLSGWNYNDQYCYISLFNNGSYVGYRNIGQKIPETGWDSFALTVYLLSYNNNIESIHFETLKTIDGIVSRAITDEPSYIHWKKGYYDPSTGAYDGTTSPDNYRCSSYYFKRELLKYIVGWDFQTDVNYICLYNSSGNFVGIINNGSTSRLYDDNWSLFTLNVYLTTSPVSIPEIRFLQMLNNHVGIEVSTAAELIDAVQIAINNTDRERYYDIYLKSGTYELWPVLDKTQIIGTGDQLYHRGLELPDKCNLFGIGDVVLSCTIPESDNSEEHPYTHIVSTLNMHNTENVLENIHFVGNNTRYCIHDDSGFDEQNKQLIVRRCKFTHNGTESETYMPDPRCYGAGFATGRKAVFENCVFDSAGNCDVQFYVHTQIADYNKSDCETVIRECAFITDGKRAIDYQVINSDTPGGVITVSNCFFADNNEFYIRGGASPTTNHSATVFGSGNSPVTVTNLIEATMYFVE